MDRSQEVENMKVVHPVDGRNPPNHLTCIWAIILNLKPDSRPFLRGLPH